MDRYQIWWDNVYNMDETGNAVLYKANSRLCYWYSSDILHCSRFLTTEKVSDLAQTIGMDYSGGMYLHGWDSYSTFYHFQRRKLDDKLDTFELIRELALGL